METEAVYAKWGMESMRAAFDRLDLPPYMWAALERWVMDGQEPGDFLRALLDNDLVGSFARADQNNAAAMGRWATFIYNYLPSSSWGQDRKEVWKGLPR